MRKYHNIPKSHPLQRICEPLFLSKRGWMLHKSGGAALAFLGWVGGRAFQLLLCKVHTQMHLSQNVLLVHFGDFCEHKTCKRKLHASWNNCSRATGRRGKQKPSRRKQSQFLIACDPCKKLTT